MIPCNEPVPRRLLGKKSSGQTLPTKVYDGGTGQLRVPMGISAEVLADRIIEIREDYEDLGELRDAARRRIGERFSVNRYCSEVESFYDEVLDARP